VAVWPSHLQNSKNNTKRIVIKKKIINLDFFCNMKNCNLIFLTISATKLKEGITEDQHYNDT